MTQPTQSAFDLASFSGAFERHDPAAQLAWYAEDAEVSVLLHDQPTAPLQRITGKADIGDWLTTSAMEYAQIGTVVMVDGPERVLIAECRRPDGTYAVYASTVRVVDDLITHQHVVLLEDEGVKVAPLRDGGRLLLPVFSV